MLHTAARDEYFQILRDIRKSKQEHFGNSDSSERPTTDDSEEESVIARHRRILNEMKAKSKPFSPFKYCKSQRTMRGRPGQWSAEPLPEETTYRDAEIDDVAEDKRISQMPEVLSNFSALSSSSTDRAIDADVISVSTLTLQVNPHLQRIWIPMPSLVTMSWCIHNYSAVLAMSRCPIVLSLIHI